MENMGPIGVDQDTVIVEFVERGDFGLASRRKPEGGYEYLWYKEPIATGIDGKKALEVVWAAFESAQTGKTVYLD